MKQKIQTSRVYADILNAEKAGYNVIILQGGSRSSKTWSIFQFFMVKALNKEVFDVTITRESLQLNRDTLLRDFDEMNDKYRLGVTPEINPDRPRQVYNIENGEFIFWGLDKPRKAHGRKQKYTWMNEVIEIPRRDVFDQLELRTEKLMILDFNPSDEDRWVFDLYQRPDVIVIGSTVKDNPFIGQKTYDKIMSYEPTEENIKNATADQYMWDVYGLGKPAKLEGLVYNNWDIVDDIPEEAKDIGLGLDFGYSNDPTALIDMYMFNNEIYLDELIYERGLKNTSPYKNERTIVSLLRDLGIGNREITADSAEPKSIDEIASHGFNINGADKGRDSIKFGVDLLLGYKIHVTRRSLNLQKELRKYKWAQDRFGKSLNVPVDEFNHGLDAVRYRAIKVLTNEFEVKIYPSGII